jgi:hypothetical protein
MGMYRKVGMNVQEPAAGGLVDATAFQPVVLLQVLDAGNSAEPFQEGGELSSLIVALIVSGSRSILFNPLLSSL